MDLNRLVGKLVPALAGVALFGPYRGPGDFGSADLAIAYPDVLRYVTPGNHETSPLWRVMNGTDPVLPAMPMPPATLLPPEQRSVIAAWIDGGAAE